MDRSLSIIANTKRHPIIATISWIAPGLVGIALLADSYIRCSHQDLGWAMLCIYIAITCFLVRRERLKLYDALLGIGIDAIRTDPIVLKDDNDRDSIDCVPDSTLAILPPEGGDLNESLPRTPRRG